jgi:hypothetical protein
MRPTLSPVVVLLGASLSLLPGCESTKSSSPSPTDTRTQASLPSADAEAWKRARVGDQVIYDVRAVHGPDHRTGAERKLQGRLTLEVVSVQQPWVWVRLGFTDEAGGALPQARLPRELVVPVRADATRPLDVPRGGEATAEKTSLAGREWEAIRYTSDQRPVDGPLRTRVYANTPGPLYLTHGLMQATTQLAGFRTPGGHELKLREVREGSADASAPAPSMERPLGPGTYYERDINVQPNPGVQRVCFGAEQGYLLRTEAPVGVTDEAPCSDFSQAEPEALEEALMSMVSEAVATDWPPASIAARTRGTFRADDRDVPALVEQSREDTEGVQREFSETYAADPWAPGLRGLSVEARFMPLASATSRVAAGGKLEPESGTRLVRWGFWVPVTAK